MIRRSLIVFCAFLVGALMTTFSLAMSVANTRPSLAAAMAPYLSRPKSRIAELTLAATLESGGTATAEQLARRAALLDPFNVAAVRTLGYAKRAAKSDRTANALFAYANELTRRDLAVNMDYVLEAAKRNDVNAAIRHFDLGLRTNRRSWDQLFPLMYRISANPAVIPGLVSVLRGEPQWKWPFLDGLVREGPDPRVTSRLLAELERTGPLKNDDLQRALISRLLDGGHYDEALARYRTFAREKRIRSISNGEFERPVLGVPFEWTGLHEGAIETGTVENASNRQFGKSFYFRVPPDAEGELLRLTVVLRHGAHRLSMVVGPAIEGQAGSLTFSAECLGSGATIAEVVAVPPRVGENSFAFVIPTGCPAVRLYLRAASGDDQSPWVSWLDRIELDNTPA